MNLNRADLIGRVTKTPELKKLPSGVSVASFGVATNFSYKSKAGEKVEKVSFHNCKIFGVGAEVFSAYVVKGQEVYVSGRIEYQEWEKKDGTKAQKTEILVDNFQFGQKPKSAQGQPQESAATGAATIEETIPDEEVKIEDVSF